MLKGYTNLLGPGHEKLLLGLQPPTAVNSFPECWSSSAWRRERLTLMLSVAEVCPSLHEMDSSTAKEDPAAGSNPAARQLMEQAWAKVEENYYASLGLWECRPVRP